MQMEALLSQLGADQGLANNPMPVATPEENPLNNIQMPPGV